MDRVEEAVPKSDEEYSDSDYSDSDDSDLYLDVKHKKYSCGDGEKLSVWWDLENGDLYNHYRPRQIMKLKNKFHEMNGHGPLSIFCYGDTTKIRESVRNSLICIGARFKYYSEDMKDWFYANIIIEMLKWAKENPPPATLILILDDGQTCYVAGYLQAMGYKLVVAQFKESQQHGDSSLFPSDSDNKMDDGVEAVPKENVDF
ncbi:hypothetical protein P8452_67873 [Trifolium repens]|jgi:hypothetical protein|nr:putative endonuclease or glycosyl hydrolase with C2H2-type zinc finger domain-containing protein [Trifolium repens]WJX85415.1 hypothetical protein P8452_67873 [Trifolium repens]